jgi:hypothetical protein
MLPTTLAPTITRRGAALYPGRSALQAVARPPRMIPGTPVDVVAACRDAIIAAARPHGVIHVDAASAGRMQSQGNGQIAAPLEIRIVYARDGGTELRQSRVSCLLNGRGEVVSLR